MEKNVIALFLFLLMLLVHGLRHLPVSSYYIQMIFFSTPPLSPLLSGFCPFSIRCLMKTFPWSLLLSSTLHTFRFLYYLLWVRLGHRSCKLAGLGQGMGVKECKELTGTALDLAFSSGVQKVTHYRDGDEGKDTME